MKPRDSQRSKVYKAEWDALHPISAMYPEVADVQAFVDRIQRSRWFKKRWPRMLRIIVLDGRGRRRGGGKYRGLGMGTIKLPRWTRSSYYILHELAHVLTTRMYGLRAADHGPEFCSIYMALIKRWMGPDAAALLRSAYKSSRVKWRLNGKNG